MYSPKIDEQHIPALYRLARARGVSMTALVNDAVAFVLSQPESQRAIAATRIPPKYATTLRKAS